MIKYTQGKRSNFIILSRIPFDKFEVFLKIVNERCKGGFKVENGFFISGKVVEVVLKKPGLESEFL
ncbi:hypothetical protein NG798_02570 [Ancylothrix sp. C2]|nr:hypothetical protein [Ancylothrix sp. D3o]